MKACPARTARANGVSDRIQIAGHCDRNALRAAIAKAKRPILVFADIEGYESQLLDPAALPELGSVDLFMETHDAVVPRCTALMIDRLRPTHKVERFVARQRVVQDFPKGFMPVLPKHFPGLALDAKNHILFAACRNPASMVILNAQTGKILATLPIGTGIDADGFDP